LLARRQGRAHTTKTKTIWHDTAGHELQAQGLALAEQAGSWRLERMVPNGHADWLPATPAPVLAEAPNAATLSAIAPDRLVPVAAFTGTRRSFPLTSADGPARLDVLEGALRGVAHDEPACRVRLSGAAPDMASFARELAEQAALTVPRAGLAACAIAVARGVQPAPRHTGAPRVAPGMNVDQALVLITSHLADVILHWAQTAPDGVAPEPVHQMRVAIRRLRTALSVFGRAASAPMLDSLADDLKQAAAKLGVARDWDVFLAETASPVQVALPGDRRVAGLITAAARRRAAAYDELRAYLGSPAWRRLTLLLALLPTLRPWSIPAGPEQLPESLQAPAEAYAAQALHRAFKRLLSAGEDLRALDAAALHETRKQAKKLRYAIEFFAPLFGVKPVRRFVEKLVDLQHALGALNDGAVAAALMQEIGGGVDRAFAIGAVQGYLAAVNAPVARSSAKAWRKLADQDRFWA
jgi:CHAD domain-containing protein